MAATVIGASTHGGEVNLVLPDLGSVTALGGTSGRLLLTLGIFVCVLGLGFGGWVYAQLRSLPVHASMLEVSELIYTTCKAYLAKQGKFLPGSRIPVVDEAHLRADRPDVVLILPWNLRDEVVAQLAYIREWGGRFAVAVPGWQELP